MADKKGRVNSIIKKDLSDIIIYELKTPITQFVSVNDVIVSSDYSYCKVYISNINSSKTEEIVAFLNNNSKKIRTMLSKKLDIFKTPSLTFIVDTTYEKEKAMKELVERANNRKPVTLDDVFKNEEKEESKVKKPSSKKKVETTKPVVKEEKKKTTKKESK